MINAMTERLEHYRNLSDISDKWRVKENQHFFFKIFFVILEYLNIFTSVIMQHQQPQKKLQIQSSNTPLTYTIKRIVCF